MRASTWMAALCLAGALAACNDDEGTTTAPVHAPVAAMADVGPLATGDPATPGGFVVEPLGRGGFVDAIDVTFRIKLGSPTLVAHVPDPADVLVARLTFQPGGSVGWHTHPGPAIVTVVSGALSIVNASDCVHRLYPAGKAFIDPGQGNVHVGFNETAGETVVYVTFLDVPPGQSPTIPAPQPAGCTV